MVIPYFQAFRLTNSSGHFTHILQWDDPWLSLSGASYLTWAFFLKCMCAFICSYHLSGVFKFLFFFLFSKNTFMWKAKEISLPVFKPIISAVKRLLWISSQRQLHERIVAYLEIPTWGSKYHLQWRVYSVTWTHYHFNKKKNLWYSEQNDRAWYYDIEYFNVLDFN